ncbi:MAG: peptidoglycan-binding protein [Bryobacterales bacterium]|nr:peptidoglycan-binding protein [Bryobacterales bacterium]
MPTHTVAEGDCLASIAAQYGFFPDTLWNAPENAALRQSRLDPNVLSPGDSVFIPDLRPRPEPLKNLVYNKFRRKNVPSLFRLQLFRGQRPRALQSFQALVDNSQTITGTTDANGILSFPIPPNAAEIRLTIGPDKFQATLQLGLLAPIDSTLGGQQRLLNLGYFNGPADAELSESWTAALAAFQRESALPESKSYDPATQAKLLSRHDKSGGPWDYRTGA